MPKFILATVALFLGREGPSGAIAHDAMHARTRGRDATRRLRAVASAADDSYCMEAPGGTGDFHITQDTGKPEPGRCPVGG